MKVKNFKKKLPPIPKFKNYGEELNFWRNHKLSDYIDFGFRNRGYYSKDLKQTLKIRFSADDLRRLRKIATQKGLGITTFIRLKMRDYLEKQSKLTGN